MIIRSHPVPSIGHHQMHNEIHNIRLSDRGEDNDITGDVTDVTILESPRRCSRRFRGPIGGAESRGITICIV